MAEQEMNVNVQLLYRLFLSSNDIYGNRKTWVKLCLSSLETIKFKETAEELIKLYESRA
jgi:hypothetical protein